MSIPRSLNECLRSGKLIPFVGAGVSKSIARKGGGQLFPDWKGLLELAATALEAEHKHSDADLVRAYLNIAQPKYLEAAQHARDALGSIWHEFLKKHLNPNFDLLDESSLALPQAIWALGSQLIVTTNYDRVLQWGCPNTQDYRGLDIEPKVELAALLRNGADQPTVWHLHGKIDNAAELILTTDDYGRLYPHDGETRYKAALEALKHYLASKSLLFIGFSFDDQYFDTQFRHIREIFDGATGPQYILMREGNPTRDQALKDAGLEIVTFADFGAPQLDLLAEMAGVAKQSPPAPYTPTTGISSAIYDPCNPPFHIPFRQKGDQVIGREHALQEVREVLTQGHPTAIGQAVAFRGLGGLGKTQLAVEYAYRFKDAYPNGVIWLNADQDIDSQLIDLAEKSLWIAPLSEHKIKLDVARQRLRSHSDCLIIFDNVEREDTLAPYLPEPQANPHILVTSRIDLPSFTPVPLETLDSVLSLSLLIQEAGRTPTGEAESIAAQGIADDLSGLPLALELAGAYLRHRPSVGWVKYRDLLNQNLKAALPSKLTSFTKHDADLYATLKVGEEVLGEEPRLGDVLNVLTWSGTAPMGLELLCALLAMENPMELAGALALGVELRLLQKTPTGENYAIHRLVGEVRREEDPLAGREAWIAEICQRIGDWFQEHRNEYTKLLRFEAEIDHLQAWQAHARAHVPSHAPRLTWLHAYPLYKQGRYREALNTVEQALGLLRKQGSIDRELEAHLFNDLAAIQSALGNSRDALKNNEEALLIRRELFGDIHADTAMSLSNLANDHDNLGNPKHALTLGARALSIRRKLFGEQNAYVAMSLSNIAGYHYLLDKPKLALEFDEQALAIRRELFGECHPDTATSLLSISRYYATGKPKLALELAEQALAIYRELFGERHPVTAASLYNIAIYHDSMGKPVLALEHARQALAIRHELFGEYHPDVAITMSHIAILSRHINPASALSMMKQALNILKETRGKQHFGTLRTAGNLSTMLKDMGQRPEALAVLDEYLTGLSRDNPSYTQLRNQRQQLLSKPIARGFRQPSAHHGSQKKKKRK